MFEAAFAFGALTGTDWFYSLLSFISYLVVNYNYVVPNFNI